LTSRVIVDIHSNSPESGYFRREFGETAVVLPVAGKALLVYNCGEGRAERNRKEDILFSFVGVGHGGKVGKIAERFRGWLVLKLWKMFRRLYMC
jgi:hypothetical protein